MSLKVSSPSAPGSCPSLGHVAKRRRIATMIQISLRCDLRRTVGDRARQARPSRRECQMSVYDLTGRNALVAGGARGLGPGRAEALARAGAGVVIGDIREDLGEATAEAIKKPGGNAAFL